MGDDPEAIGEELSHAFGKATLIFTTGGLGPTADDRTVAAIAPWLGVRVVRSAEFLDRMRSRFERRGFRMPPTNEKQADFLEGARVLENPRGTAPGFWARKDGVEIVVLPGVPSEMREIMTDSVLPLLRERSAGVVSRRRVLRIAGMGESAVEELVAPVYDKWKEHPPRSDEERRDSERSDEILMDFIRRWEGNLKHADSRASVIEIPGAHHCPSLGGLKPSPYRRRLQQARPVS